VSSSLAFDTAGVVTTDTMPCVAVTGTPCPATPAIVVNHDAMGRPTKITDGGTGYQTLSYSANDVLITAGPAPSGENTKRRQIEYDGFGRVTSTCEITSATGSTSCGQSVAATGFVTKYTYNLASKLTKVTQGAQTRTYTYDMLGRLTSETNPESGTRQFFWDASPAGSPGFACALSSTGDLVKVYDANGVTKCFSYDQLHRMTQSWTTPNASGVSSYYVYDNAVVNSVTMQNAKGRLAEAYTATCPTCAKVTDLGLGYTQKGETATTYESTPHSAGYYTVGTTFWPNGLINQLNAVGLPTFTYSLNAEGQPTAVFAMTGQNPVIGTNYNAAGLATLVNFGSGDSATFGFDSNTGRLTSYASAINGTTMSGTLTWNANGTLNNLVIADPFNAPDAQTCNYTYDDLARTIGANCGSVWGQTFSYDQYGNISKNGSSSWLPGYTASTNRYNLAGTSYDGNGNLLNDSIHAYGWNTDNRLTSIDTTLITYDALGRMVEVNTGGVFKEYVYLQDHRLATMSGQTVSLAFIPLPGGAQAKYVGTTVNGYRVPDWLGSYRITLNTNRTYQAGLAYGAYGEAYAALNSPQKGFTGSNSDETTVGDYDFLYREENAAQGRWLSSDPAGITSTDVTHPQTWNRYAYVGNQSMNNTDPLGLECSPASYNKNGDLTTVCSFSANDGGFGGQLFNLEQKMENAFRRRLLDSIARAGQKHTHKQSVNGKTYDVLDIEDSMWVVGMVSGGAGAGGDIGAELAQLEEEVGNGWFERLAKSNWFGTGYVAPTVTKVLTGDALEAAVVKNAGAEAHAVGNVRFMLSAAREGYGTNSVEQIESGLNKWLQSNGATSLRDAMKSVGVNLNP
jgi:RHS repeat-associated protein